MQKLKVTPAQLRAAKSTLDSSNTRLRSQVEAMRNLEQRLNRMWDGAANDAFHKAFTSDVQQFNNFSDLIKKYSSALENAAQQYETRERKNQEIATKRGSC